jgi:hypothetical protein
MDTPYQGAAEQPEQTLCRYLGNSCRYFLRMRESGEGQLAVAAPTGDQAARPARRRAAVWRLLTVVAAAGLTVGLYFCYLLQSRPQSANSDAVSQVLQGWDMVHNGNWLLSGWAASDVSFYTFEVPLDGLISLIYGLRVDVLHVSAAIEYALLVLLAALVAAGAGRDRRHGLREGWVRALLAAGIMIAPGAVPGAHILLLAPDHTGIGVPVLATLLVVDLVRPSARLTAIAFAALVCVMLTWAQLDDPVAEFGAALPLALACAVPLAALPFRWLFRLMRRRKPDAGAPPRGRLAELAQHSYDLALVVAAVVSYVLTKWLVQVIGNAGGFYLHPIPNGGGQVQISNLTLLGRQFNALGQNLMYLFGANFWGQAQPLTAYAYLHLAGLAVALLGLLVAFWKWPRADRVTRTLTLAVLLVAAAGAVSPLSTPISGAHEIAIVLPLSAALAGRCLGPWLAGRRRPATAAEPGARPKRLSRLGTAVRLAAAGLLIAVGLGYLANLGYNASQPAAPVVNKPLANWLLAHDLTSGLGGYWDANITNVVSGGAIRIAPLTIGADYGYLWEAKRSWFDPAKSSANFVIAHEGHLGAGYLYVGTATSWFGKPSETYYLGQTVILVYDRNLIYSVIQPQLANLQGPHSSSGVPRPTGQGLTAP